MTVTSARRPGIRTLTNGQEDWELTGIAGFHARRLINRANPCANAIPTKINTNSGNTTDMGHLLSAGSVIHSDIVRAGCHLACVQGVTQPLIEASFALLGFTSELKEKCRTATVIDTNHCTNRITWTIAAFQFS